MGPSSYPLQKGEADHLSEASSNTRALYHRYKDAVLTFGDDVTIIPTKTKYIGFRVNNRRFATFHIHPGHFKIWLRIKPGSIDNALRLTNKTQVAYTIRVSDDRHFNYVIDLLKQAYVRNK